MLNAFCCVVVSLLAIQAPVQALPDRSDRAAFSLALVHIKRGMTEKQVLAVIGRPDYIRPTPYATPEMRPAGDVTWYYGSPGKNSMGTLGQVRFGSANSVSDVMGASEQAPVASRLFREDELRPILLLLDSTRGLTRHYDPLAYIRIVNAPQPLGKERALAAISEFLRVSANHEAQEGIFFVLRVLFDVPNPPAHMPQMLIGAMAPLEPTDMRICPRFPVIIVDDVPFSVLDGLMLGGVAQNPAEHVEYFRKHGAIRKELLRPPDDPMRIMSDLKKSQDWIWNRPYSGRGMMGDKWNVRDEGDVVSFLRDEWLRVVDTLYHVEDDNSFYGTKLVGLQHPGKAWTEVENSFRAMKTRWDPAAMRYTMVDGSTPGVKARKQLTWSPAIGRLAPEFRLFRHYGKHMILQVVYASKTGEEASVLVMMQGGPHFRLAQMTLSANEPVARVGGGTNFNLDAGRCVKLVVEYKGKRTESPTYQP